jgi:rare lipoprotein A
MRPNLLILAAAILVGATAACGKKPIEVATSERPQFVQTGVASWYGNGLEGGKTASGERFDPDEMTAAHRTLPFGTMVRVTNLRNNRSIDVRITNRGPFIKGRIIDLSPAAARQLQIGKSGVVKVRIEASAARKKTHGQ